MDKKLFIRKTTKFLKIVLGTFIYALGFQFFTYPNSIVPGGVTGVAMIINYLTQLPVGVLSIIINIPLFAFSWKKFGTEFMVSSLVGMLGCSVFVDILSGTGIVATNDPLLGSIYGGVIKGLGLGIVFTTAATTGGVDIVAKILRKKYPYINFGTLVLCVDAAVIMSFALIFSRLESAMYSAICQFISSKLINFVLYGAVNSKVCYIITNESDMVKDAITEKLHRGVTFLHGEGAWSGEEKEIILCVIKMRQIVELKEIVRACDEHAFMIVSDSHEVFGKGFSRIDEDK